MTERIICTEFDGETVWENAAVVIEDGFVTGITATGEPPDGNYFLMPGLIDAHTHMGSKAHADAMLLVEGRPDRKITDSIKT